jgi:hypothetical protein
MGPQWRTQLYWWHAVSPVFRLNSQLFLKDFRKINFIQVWNAAVYLLLLAVNYSHAIRLDEVNACIIKNIRMAQSSQQMYSLMQLCSYISHCLVWGWKQDNGPLSNFGQNWSTQLYCKGLSYKVRKFEICFVLCFLFGAMIKHSAC